MLLQVMRYNARMKNDPVPILTHAIAVEGNASKLAIAMNVAPSTVTAWKTRGLPTHIACELVRRYARRKLPKSPYEWKPKEQR